ncbi:biotin--[acetyl-CoA-carboxylase] ligase [Legionella sp. 16cNR16C]|uniref:biotin--[acetyl-CoA-carboxylase] ligase n=1 Tax=Legionella sp. 16cNR16C TaxID=2905656 RepID=UPI001E2C65CD|nr:biotin--[acetyl-CoA-carboxylase] ligase [Legionella sp. 16cNR16C]MCE3044776.1 biotin--[acetyl-CoA-carboxylase] ligase [Legionella sp. 16cNR16C]
MRSSDIKMFTSLQRQILHLLADGTCQSGEYLARQFGVSRTAIWKQIHQLTLSGLPIESIPKQGYRLLKPFIPLDKEKILSQLPGHLKNETTVYQFSEIDSSNRFLKDLPIQKNLTICCTEKQTQGRGRFGRSWASPFGENIYLSVRWEMYESLSRLSGLSLAVSLAVVRALHNAGVQNEIQIKWPNDLIWQGKKLGGILIEMIAESHSSASVIIGIGINVNTDPKESDLSDNPWCSLLETGGQYWDRNRLIAEIVSTLDQDIEHFLKNGFSSFLPLWNQHDYLRGKTITVQQFNSRITGEARGIDPYGQLCLRDNEGLVHYLSSGDTSLNGF